jgi:hypothetical protein
MLARKLVESMTRGARDAGFTESRTPGARRAVRAMRQ